jgi:hypothetical protein
MIRNWLDLYFRRFSSCKLLFVFFHTYVAFFLPSFSPKLLLNVLKGKAVPLRISASDRCLQCGVQPEKWPDRIQPYIIHFGYPPANKLHWHGGCFQVHLNHTCYCIFSIPSFDSDIIVLSGQIIYFMQLVRFTPLFAGTRIKHSASLGLLDVAPSFKLDRVGFIIISPPIYRGFLS